MITKVNLEVRENENYITKENCIEIEKQYQIKPTKHKTLYLSINFSAILICFGMILFAFFSKEQIIAYWIDLALKVVVGSVLFFDGFWSSLTKNYCWFVSKDRDSLRKRIIVGSVFIAIGVLFFVSAIFGRFTVDFSIINFFIK